MSSYSGCFRLFSTPNHWLPVRLFALQQQHFFSVSTNRNGLFLSSSSCRVALKSRISVLYRPIVPGATSLPSDNWDLERIIITYNLHNTRHRPRLVSDNGGSPERRLFLSTNNRNVCKHQECV